MLGYRINYTSDRAAAVEQRRGTLNHFDFLEAQKIDGFGVISGLEAEQRQEVADLILR